jgi:type VI secretion system protein ImpC
MSPESQQEQQQAEAAAVQVPASLLDEIVNQAKFGQTDEEKKQGKDWLEGFLAEIMRNQILVSDDTQEMINARIAQLDTLLSNELNQILHAPEFQKLEATWRGLHYLVDQTETSTTLKIKVMNVTKKELLADFKGASEFDQSNVFKKVYEEEYGTLGGVPFGVLIGDYYFGSPRKDVQRRCRRSCTIYLCTCARIVRVARLHGACRSPRPCQDL